MHEDNIGLLKNTIRDSCGRKNNPSGTEYCYLSVGDVSKIAASSGMTKRQVEIAALQVEVVPDRYERSIGTIGIGGQIRLLESTAGVLGAGGLGGMVIENLARMGVGRLVIVDDDVFTDSNMNRQLLATEMSLGKAKTEAARDRVAAVNSAVEVVVHKCRGDASNLPELFADCNLAVDCLDNLSSRYDLEEVCSKLDIPMIHGAIAGYLGQLAVIKPGKPLLSAIYGKKGDGQFDRGAEVQLGNPAATPSMLASWQSSEAVKVLAGVEGVLPSNMMLIIDMQSGDSYRVEVDS